MPLQMPTPPEAIATTVQSTLSAFADQHLFTTPALRDTVPGGLTLSLPHQIYTIGVEDLAGGTGLSSARPVGWRYLISSAGKAIGCAETVITADGSQVFSQFNEGPFVAATSAAVAAAQTLPQLGLGLFELRLLRIPALYIMALWLEAPGGIGSLLVPLEPSPIGRAGVATVATERLSVLSNQARAKLANRPSGENLAP
jgi:hypothetical protein